MFAKLSWVEAMVWCDRKLIMVCCKMCSEIEGREKNLVPKFDSVQKHASRQKCKVACPRSVVGYYFMLTKSQNVKIEHKSKHC